MNIGIVGHRFLDAKQSDFVSVQCRRILANAGGKDTVEAWSAIAVGADTIFAEVALDMQIPLHVLVPFSDYAADFENETTAKTFSRLQSAAYSITVLPFTDRSEDAYYEGMQWVLKKADVIIAAWNGEANGGRGGTADAVQQLIRDKRNWVHIDSKHFSVHWHPGDPNLLTNLFYGTANKKVEDK